MGRKKIKIDYLTDEKLRQVTYCKRKKGLLKKAMELSLLCGTHVLLIMRDANSERATLYCSEEERTLFDPILTENRCTESYTNNSYDDLFGKEVKKGKRMKDIDHSRKKSRKRTRAEPVVRTKSSEAAEPASESRPEPEAEKTNSIKAEEVLHEGQDAAAQAPKEETKGESNSEPHNKSPAATDVTPAVQPPRFENKLRKKGFGLSVPLPPMPDVASILSGGGYAPQSMCNGFSASVGPYVMGEMSGTNQCAYGEERRESAQGKEPYCGYSYSPCVAHMSASMGYNRDPFLSPAFSAFRPGDNMGFYSPVPSANVYAQQQRSDKKD